jgi:hypothetical protein
MSDHNKVFIDKRSQVVYLPAAGGAIGKTPSTAKPAGSIPTAPANTTNLYTDKIAAWGIDNLFPQKVLKECEVDTIVPTTLRFMARALYGGGLSVGKVTGYKPDGSEIFEPIKYQPWIDFARRSNINRYFIEACNDFYWFYNVFPELILTKDRSEIYSLNCQEAMYCRWSKQDASGLVKSCYIHGNWEEWPLEKDCKRVSVIDPYDNPVASTKARNDSWKYIYPVSYPSPGKTYYQLAHWNGLRSSGWLDYAKAIPQIKKNYSENSVAIAMTVEVADWYWTWKYPDWDDNQKEQEQRMKDTYQAFNDFIAGKANAGKTLFLPVKTHPETFQAYPGWKLSPIDKGSKENRFIEDSNEPSSHLLYALGVDPAIIGMTPGKSMGAGSGSDKRVAFNVYVSLCQADRDAILEPLYFIRDYNGWDPELEFRFRYPLITTLDKGKESQQQTS